MLSVNTFILYVIPVQKYMYVYYFLRCVYFSDAVVYRGERFETKMFLSENAVSRYYCTALYIVFQ